jgi:hypothetical protein
VAVDAQAVERPAAVAAAKKFIDSAKSTVGAWAETKPWINETLKENLLMDVQVLETWLQEKEEEQSAVKPHEEPAFKAKVLTSKVRLFKLIGGRSGCQDYRDAMSRCWFRCEQRCSRLN